MIIHRTISPEDAIPPVPYHSEPPLWHVLDEVIFEAEQARRDEQLWRGIYNGLIISALIWGAALVVWLALS